MMETSRQLPYSSMSLLSRLDHLDFIIKHIKGKQNLQKLGTNSSAQNSGRKSMPSDLAASETYFKGSLLDRVASLEHRLFQLYIEMESRSTSNTSSSQTSGSGYASSSQGFKYEPHTSLPTFKNLNLGPKDDPILHGPPPSPIQENCSKNEKKEKSASENVKPKKVVGKKNPSKDDHNKKKTTKSITGKKKKKKTSTTVTHKFWPYMRICGC